MRVKMFLRFICCALLLACCCLHAQSPSPDKPAKEYIYVGGRLLTVETLAGANGTTVAPFSSVLEWSRNDQSQFTTINVGASGVTITPTLRTTQADSSYTVLPYVEWTVTSGTGPAYQYFLANQAYAPTADEDLVIEADVAYYGIDQINGLGCFDPNNPTSNYYLLARDSNGKYRLRKVVGGAPFTQGQDSTSAESPTAIKGQKARVRFVLTQSGGVRVYSAGTVLFDLPMTLSNSTVLSACRPGFVVSAFAVQYAGGFAYSRLRVFRMKADGEEIF